MTTFYDLTKTDETLEERIAKLEGNVDELEGIVYYASGNGNAGVVWR